MSLTNELLNLYYRRAGSKKDVLNKIVLSLNITLTTRMADVIDAALATAGTPCELGNDPSKYLEKFEDWYEHTSLLADAIGITSDDQKLRLMLLWGGKEKTQRTHSTPPSQNYEQDVEAM